MVYIMGFISETPLYRVVKAVGGQVKAGEICDVTAAIIGRWIKRGYLPRTEYTGETNYAERLSIATNGFFSKEWILEEAHPLKVKGIEEEQA